MSTTNKSDEAVTKNRHAAPPQTNKSLENSKDNQAATTLPLDVYHIVRDLVLFFCRRIIFGPPRFKLLVSFAIILIGSILKSLDLAPTSYFSLKHNIFNRYFAKLGWAWTIGLLFPFIYLTLMTTHNNYQIVTRHLVRLLVATGVWYIITYMFVSFEAYTGMCKHEKMRGASRKICVGGGYEWQEGHDFSGHTFLLLYSLLIINEEVKSYDKGTKKVQQASQSTKASGDTLGNISQDQLKLISKIIQIIYVLLAALTILWEFMLLSTALYYHHTFHKLAAAFVAVFFWYITYYVWYRPNSTSILYPSSPKE
ncbi:unnamed protein product [Adineta steineri]|uniref:FIT family protein n=1 Tax=Adineta steineri TaxID=433720 RepID=A0A815XSA7_9BILA|nr:unnamed protein product [Adineta steineri]CAF1561776.1 unnamed protein product [Adineta steineri]